MVGKQKGSGGAFLRSRNRQIKEHTGGSLRPTKGDYDLEEGNEKSHRPPTKKNSIVDTISAMEFCFICEKQLIFALLPLILAVLRAFFRMNTSYSCIAFGKALIGFGVFVLVKSLCLSSS